MVMEKVWSNEFQNTFRILTFFIVSEFGHMHMLGYSKGIIYTTKMREIENAI